jgi:uncharacterized protein with von Willebrand factor type A (vWA) domain
VTAAVGQAEDLARRHLQGFVTALAGSGVVPGAQKQVDFLQAVALLRPAAPGELYWAARVTLVRALEELEAFDRVFAAWFGDGLVPLAAPVRRPPPRLPASRRGRLAGGPEGDAVGGRTGAGRQASVEELRSNCAFPATSAAQRRLLAEAEAALNDRLPAERALRHRPARHGERLDLRRVLRAAGRSGGEVLRFQWRDRRRRLRRVLLLVDVSGSLRQSSGDALRFAHALVRTVPRCEVYTFGTRLTRVTHQLAKRDVDAALDGLADVVVDVNGGTRIGRALEELLADGRRSAAARDALVLIVSDGLERGGPGAMAAAVKRLARLAHRVVWWSPLACDANYQPVTRGMAAVVGDLDDLAGVRDLASAVDAVRRLSAVEAGRRRQAGRRSARPGQGRLGLGLL